MGSDYGSWDLAILAASNRTHRPLITISHCLIMGIDYGSLRSLNPPFHTMYWYVAFLGCSLGSIGGGPEKDREFCCWALSIAPPRIRLASWRSFGVMVTLLACIAHKFMSSNSPTKYASAASWRHNMAADWKRRSVLKSCAISLTNLWNSSFLIRSADDFW